MYKSLINFFYTKYVNINWINQDGDTPLHIAIQRCHPRSLHKENIATVKSLIDRGANVNIANNKGETPLYLAIRDIKKIEDKNLIVDKLLVHQASFDIKVSDGDTPLLLAIRRNNIEIIQKLIDCGAKIDSELISYKIQNLISPYKYFCLHQPSDDERRDKETLQLLSEHIDHSMIESAYLEGFFQIKEPYRVAKVFKFIKENQLVRNDILITAIEKLLPEAQSECLKDEYIKPIEIEELTQKFDESSIDTLVVGESSLYN
jgi:hypothetical protein